MYHLPLLPGYGPNTNVRSSAAPKKRGKSVTAHLSEAEENGYQGTYFVQHSEPSADQIQEGYISTSPLTVRRSVSFAGDENETTTDAETERGFATEPEPAMVDVVPRSVDDPGAETDPGIYGPRPTPLPSVPPPEEHVGEVIFFEYGVVVFFGLSEADERGILDDVDNAAILRRKIPEEDWEVEECHFTVRFPQLELLGRG